MNVKNLTTSARFILKIRGEITMEELTKAAEKDNEERTKIRGNGNPDYGRPGYKEHL